MCKPIWFQVTPSLVSIGAMHCLQNTVVNKHWECRTMEFGEMCLCVLLQDVTIEIVGNASSRAY